RHADGRPALAQADRGVPAGRPADHRRGGPGRRARGQLPQGRQLPRRPGPQLPVRDPGRWTRAAEDAAVRRRPTAGGAAPVRAAGAILLASRAPLPRPVQPALGVDVDRPTPDEQRAVWRHLRRQYYAPPKRNGTPPPAPPEPELDAVAGRLAAQFNFNAPAIAQ